MVPKYIIVNYLNYISRLLVVINQFPYQVNQLLALHDFKKIEETTCEEFDLWWKHGYEKFLTCLDDKIIQLETSLKQDKYIIAYTLCICLDNKIIYSNDDAIDKISLWSLLPVTKNKPVILSEPLNNNYNETQIAIHPKFEVYNVNEHIETDEEEKIIERALSIKDAFSGINGQLKHISYTKCDGQEINITDVVIDYPDSFKGDCLTVAFSPMTDQEVVEEKEEIMECGEFSFDAIQVVGIQEKYVEKMIRRFDTAWKEASANDADIIFFPELLGLQTLEEKQFSYHTHIKNLSESVMENHFDPPKITFLPSVCNNHASVISIVYQDGRSLGQQNKLRPFVDRTEHKIEAISTSEHSTIIVLHIPGVHRIAIMICSDYLTCSTEMQQKMFADLGITLLLVTSYSRGEQDFITKLSELKKYGTTVVWGNCCAATKPKRIRGGCSIAALDKVHRFNDCAQCNDICKESCLFLVKIPLRINRNQREKVSLDEVVTHLLL